jgi:hypothetical protein
MIAWKPPLKHFYDQGTWKGQINEQAWDYLLDGKRGAEDVSILHHLQEL